MDKNKFALYDSFAKSSIYSEPEQGNFHTELIPKMIDNFVGKFDLNPNSAILDIGCGQGVFIKNMNWRGFHHVTGVTASQDDFDACIDKEFQAIMSDFSDMRFRGGSFDFIWCRHALEHSPYPLFSLLEFNRVLKNGGMVYVEVPAPNCARVHENNPNHFSVLGAQMWVSLFFKTKFDLMFHDEMSLDLNTPDGQVKETYFVFGIKKRESCFAKN